MTQQNEETANAEPPLRGPKVITRPTQRQMAAEAGLSKHQEVQARRLAKIPEDVFEALVESDNPPTVTALAELGTTRQGPRNVVSADFAPAIEPKLPKPFSNVSAWVSSREDAAQLSMLMEAASRKTPHLAEPLLALSSAFAEIVRRYDQEETF